MHYIFVVSGLFAFTSAFASEDWFNGLPRAKLLTSLFGPRGARATFAIVGLILIGLGTAMFLLPGETGTTE